MGFSDFIPSLFIEIYRISIFIYRYLSGIYRNLLCEILPVASVEQKICHRLTGEGVTVALVNLVVASDY